MMTTYTGLHLYKSISQVRERPVERPKHNFEGGYEALRQEKNALEREIAKLKDEIESEKNAFAAHYDDLVLEQQEIVSTKGQEMDNLKTEITKVQSEINELENWTSATDELDEMIKSLAEKTETVKQQEQMFIDEIARYTRALTELGSHTSTTGNELLLNTTRLPKFRDQKEAAQLAKTLYSLRLVLVKRYGESLASCSAESGCSVQ